MALSLSTSGTRQPSCIRVRDMKFYPLSKYDSLIEITLWMTWLLLAMLLHMLQQVGEGDTADATGNKILRRKDGMLLVALVRGR